MQPFHAAVMNVETGEIFHLPSNDPSGIARAVGLEKEFASLEWDGAGSGRVSFASKRSVPEEIRKKAGQYFGSLEEFIHSGSPTLSQLEVWNRPENADVLSSMEIECLPAGTDYWHGNLKAKAGCHVDAPTLLATAGDLDIGEAGSFTAPVFRKVGRDLYAATGSAANISRLQRARRIELKAESSFQADSLQEADELVYHSGARSLMPALSKVRRIILKRGANLVLPGLTHCEEVLLGNDSFLCCPALQKCKRLDMGERSVADLPAVSVFESIFGGEKSQLVAPAATQVTSEIGMFDGARVTLSAVRVLDAAVNIRSGAVLDMPFLEEARGRVVEQGSGMLRAGKTPTLKYLGGHTKISSASATAPTTPDVVMAAEVTFASEAARGLADPNPTSVVIPGR